MLSAQTLPQSHTVCTCTAGMRIKVNGTFEAATTTIYVTAIAVTQAATNKDFVDGSGVVQLSSITFLINTCGNRNPIGLSVRQAAG